MLKSSGIGENKIDFFVVRIIKYQYSNLKLSYFQMLSAFIDEQTTQLVFQTIQPGLFMLWSVLLNNNFAEGRVVSLNKQRYLFHTGIM